VRGQRVILDADLAAIYGVTAKRLNEQVKRNARRFPADFLFRLNPREAAELLRSRSQIATLKRGHNIKHLPFAFTETGAVMAANVLRSPRAVRLSVFVVRAFIQMRALLSGSTPTKPPSSTSSAASWHSSIRRRHRPCRRNPWAFTRC